MAKTIEEYVQKSNSYLVKQLKGALDDTPVFEKRVTENEERKLRKGKKIRDFFIYRTGDMRATENSERTLSQDVIITYVSEMEPDLDIRALKIIGALDNRSTYSFQSARKTSARKGDTDGVVDVIEFTFTRMLKHGC